MLDPRHLPSHNSYSRTETAFAPYLHIKTENVPCPTPERLLNMVVPPIPKYLLRQSNRWYTMCGSVTDDLQSGLCPHTLDHLQMGPVIIYREGGYYIPGGISEEIFIHRGHG